MDDFTDYEFIQRFFLPLYLDNPVLSTGRTRLLVCFLDAYRYRAKLQTKVFEGTYPYREKMFVRVVLTKQKLEKTVSPLDPDEYQKFLHTLPNLPTETDDAARLFTSTVMNNVFDALSPHVPGVKVRAEIYRQKPTTAVQYWFRRWRAFDAVVQAMAKEMGGGKKMSVVSSPTFGLVIGNSQYVVCLDPVVTTPDRLLTYDQFLMLKDLCFTRYQVFCARLWFYPMSIGLDELLKKHMIWQLGCLTAYGNEGYEVAKNTEAMAKAYLSHVTDPVFGESGPFYRMIAKVRDKEKALGRQENFLADGYAAILASTRNIEYVVELFGIQKTCGHPFIDPRRGGLSAAAEARAPDKTLFSDAQRIKNNFCRIYLQAYVAKHGSWPPLVFSCRRPTTLQRLSNMQFRGLTPRSYPLEDWNTCRFSKHQEFDYHPNFLDLMDDKSISFYRSEKHATWRPAVRPRSHKRLLRELIARETVSAREIVDRVMTREVPLDWYIVSLYPKEREFKLAARMFSMLVFEIRLYFALTEANLAEGIFPYLPQQTMTKDKISILRTFGDLTKPMTEGTRVRYYLEIDLSRWNLRWRSLTVHMVGDAIDDIFGLRGVFTFVHEFFAECLILVRTPDIEPPLIDDMSPPESDTLWYNHSGGFEGITQKLWSACTYSMVDLALQQFPLSYVLIGQGDNQVVAITLQRDPSTSVSMQCQENKELVMGKIEEECARTNQEVKPEECLESGTVLTYSKDVYVRGVDYHTTLKAHSRLFPNASSDFPSLVSEVGAIFSTALAGAERTRDPLTSYSLALLHAYQYLMTAAGGAGLYGTDLRRVLETHNVRRALFVRYFLTLPSALGGGSVASFPQFLYKGGSDPLSTAVAGTVLLGRVAKAGSLHSRMLRELQDGHFLSRDTDLSSLIQDPFSIPIKKPATPTDRVASETLEALRPSVRNIDIEEIMSTSATEYKQHLVSVLTSMNPLNPLLAHDILDCSVAGLIRTMSTMFTATRTIQGFVREGGSPIVERLLSQEKASWMYYIKRLQALPTLPPDLHQSVYDTVVFLRSHWSVPPVGVTTYHPLDFPTAWGKDALEAVGVSLLVSPEATNPFFERGPHDPYLGSKTREKRAEHGYRIVGRDTSSASLRKLQLISSQIGTNPAAIAVLDDVGFSRSDTQLSAISHLLTQVVGGTVSHRYASKVGFLAAHLLGSFTFASNCVISSNNAGFLSGGYVDYPVMFQEFFLTAGAFSQLRLLTSASSPETRLLTIRIGDTPLDQISSTNITFPEGSRVPPLRLPSNPLAFVADLEIVENRSLFAPGVLDGTNLRGHFARTSAFAREVCVAWFRHHLRLHNSSRLIADSNPTITGRPLGSLDLAETAAIGIGRLVDAAALACAEEAIYHTWRTAHKTRIRWQITAFIWKISEALSLTLCEHIGHPLLVNDFLCRRFQLTTTPRYRGGSRSVTSRMTGIVAARTRALIGKHDSSLYTQRYALFASEVERSASELAYKQLCTTIHRAWVSGELNPGEGIKLMKDYVIPLGRTGETEAARIQQAQLLGHMVSEWATKSGKRTLAAGMLEVSQGSKLALYPIAVTEVLREMRDSRLWALSRKKYQPLQRRFRHLYPSVDPSSLVTKGAVAILTAAPRSLQPSSSSSADIACHQAFVASGRIHGTFSSAHYSFSPAMSSFAEREVLVVGSGHGAIARLALECGATMVHGLDLATTIPLHNHNFRWYKPPMIAMSDYAERYTQLASCFTESGDWLDPEVSTHVLEGLLKETVVVIDIQASGARYGAEVLAPLLPFRWRGPVFWRAFLTDAEAELLGGDLKAGGAEFAVYCVERSTHTPQRQYLWHIRRLPHSLVTTEWDEIRLNPVLVLPTNMEFMGGGHSYLKGELSHNVLLEGSDVPLSVLFSRLENIFLHMKGEYLSRPSYTGWTSILEALVGCWWSLLPTNEREKSLRQVALRQTITITLPTAGSLKVRGSASLTRHLSKVCARLL